MTREWDAAAYHRLSNAQFEWGKKVLARVPLRGDETVLDTGCGTGRLTAELLERLPRGRVVASDLSQNMLRAARTTLQRFKGQVSFVCADVQQLPFVERFDGVFSTATFHWAKDHDRMFGGLFAALEPGGWLVAQCGGGANLARLRQKITVLMNSPKYARHFEKFVDPWNYAGPEVTAERMRQAGFADVKTSIEPGHFSLPDAATFKQYLATVTLHRHLACIADPGLRDEFLDDLAQQWGDPEFQLDYWRLNMEGKRRA